MKKANSTKNSNLRALLFYFLDIHSPANLCGFRQHGEKRIGFFMTGAALLQLFNLYPTATATYVKAVPENTEIDAEDTQERKDGRIEKFSSEEGHSLKKTS